MVLMIVMRVVVVAVIVMVLAVKSLGDSELIHGDGGGGGSLEEFGW